jgi:hypothetical protein
MPEDAPSGRLTVAFALVLTVFATVGPAAATQSYSVPAAAAPVAEASLWTFVQAIEFSAPGTDGYRTDGATVAMSGNLAVVQTPGWNSAEGYTRSFVPIVRGPDGTWSKGPPYDVTIAPQSTDRTTGLEGWGPLSAVAVDGLRVVIGLPPVGNADSGFAQVLRWTGDRLVLEGNLTVGGLRAQDHLGTSVAVRGDVAMVGRPSSPDATDSGCGFVVPFSRAADGSWGPGLPNGIRSWMEPGQCGGGYGTHIALDGDVLAVAAPFEDGTGAVHLYSIDHDDVLPVVLHSPGSPDVREFGQDLALQNGTIAVGSWNRFVVGHGPIGAISIFERTADGAGWNPVAHEEIQKVDEGFVGQLHVAVALNRNTAVAAATEPSGGRDIVLNRDSAGWHVGEGQAWSGRYEHPWGYAAALSGDTMMITDASQPEQGYAGPRVLYILQQSGGSEPAPVERCVGPRLVPSQTTSAGSTYDVWTTTSSAPPTSDAQRCGFSCGVPRPTPPSIAPPAPTWQPQSATTVPGEAYTVHGDPTYSSSPTVETVTSTTRPPTSSCDCAGTTALPTYRVSTNYTMATATSAPAEPAPHPAPPEPGPWTSTSSSSATAWREEQPRQAESASCMVASPVPVQPFHVEEVLAPREVAHVEVASPIHAPELVPPVAIDFHCGEVACHVAGDARIGIAPTEVASSLPPVPNAVDVRYVQLDPEGGTLDPNVASVDIKVPYVEEALPTGAAETDLTVFYWNGTTWVDLSAALGGGGQVHGATPAQDLKVLSVGVDTHNNVARLVVNHTSTYAIVARHAATAPASSPTVLLLVLAGAAVAVTAALLAVSLVARQRSSSQSWEKKLQATAREQARLRGPGPKRPAH